MTPIRHSLRPRATPLLLATILSSCSAIGPSSDAQDPSEMDALRVHVGLSQQETFALSAAVASDGLVDFYVCGEGPTLATHTRWFYDVTLDEDGHFDNTVDGWQLSGDVVSDRIVGQLQEAGATAEAFELDLADADALEGVYRGDGPECAATLIVYPTPSGAVGRGSCIGEVDMTIDQVIILGPLALTSAGIQVGVASEVMPDPSRFFVTAQG